jgi:haloalkane dehalogenase
MQQPEINKPVISAEFPFRRKFVEVNRQNIAYVDVGEGLHFLQEDRPHEIGQALSQWLASLVG